MNSGFAIESVYEFRLSSEQLKRIDRTDLAAIAAAGYATNELAFLSKLLISHFHEIKRNPRLESIRRFQHNFALRLIASKSYEITKFWRDQKTRWRRNHTDIMIDALHEQFADFDQLWESPYRKVVKDLRDRISSHYLPSIYEDYLDNISSNGDFAFYLHENQGNSHYAMSEEVVFAGFLNSAFSQHQQTTNAEDQGEFIQGLVDWVMEVGKVSEASLAATIRMIILDRFPDVRAKKHREFFDKDLRQQLGEFRFPIFFEPPEDP